MLAFPLLSLSCSSDNDDPDPADPISYDEPGSISGLGLDRGELTGKDFSLPGGIVLDGDITGYYASSRTVSGTESTRAHTPPSYYYDYYKSLERRDFDVAVGNGYAVPLWIKLKNTTGSDITVTFPAGLIVKTRNWEAQYGLLVKETRVVVPGNGTLAVLMYTHCCHLGISAPNQSNILSWGVVSNSSLLLELCDLVKDKKINREEFTSYTQVYFNQAYYIQECLWNLTGVAIEGQDRYTGQLTEEEKAWFAALPASN